MQVIFPFADCSAYVAYDISVQSSAKAAGFFEQQRRHSFDELKSFRKPIFWILNGFLASFKWNGSILLWIELAKHLMMEEKIQLILYLDWYGTQLCCSPSTLPLQAVIWLAHKGPVKGNPSRDKLLLCKARGELIIQSIVWWQQTLFGNRCFVQSCVKGQSQLTGFLWAPIKLIHTEFWHLHTRVQSVEQVTKKTGSVWSYL